MDIKNLGKTPISQENPIGSDVRRDSEFKSLKKIANKYPIKWDKIVEAGISILSNKSKDLVAASFLCVGLANRKEIEGVTDAFNLFNDLLQTYSWDELYPKDIMAKKGAIDYLNENISKVLVSYKKGNKKIKQENQEQILDTLDSIKQIVDKYDMPSVGDIRRALKDISVIKKKKPPPENTQKQKNTTPPRSSSKSVPDRNKKHSTKESSEKKNFDSGQNDSNSETDTSDIDLSNISSDIENIEKDTDVNRILDTSFQNIANVGEYLLEKVPMNPKAYQYKRIDAWARVELIPPDVNNKTGIGGPPTEEQNITKRLLEEKNWSALLMLSEQKISQYNFWLDLNYYSAMALEGLGNKYKKAHEIVCRETSYFVYCFPGIEDKQFSDETPFAGKETKQWLKKIRLGGSQTSFTSVKSEDKTDIEFSSVIKNAYELMKNENLIEAVNLIQKQIQNCISKKDKMLWRLEMSKLLTEANETELAISYYDQIIDDIQKYKLEEWDIEISKKVYASAFPLYLNSADEEQRNRASIILNKISIIDPELTLRLKAK